MHTLKHIITAALLLCATSAFAYDFEVDGIYYNIISDAEVEVTNGIETSYVGDITIPETVTHPISSTSYRITTIGDAAFAGCDGLTSIVIPNSITTIGYCAFGYLKIPSINIPNSVIEIGGAAFSGCINLSSIEIPNSVTTIGESAFSGCINLSSIEIPNSVTTIEANAFSNTPFYENQPDGLIYLGNVLYEYKGDMPKDSSITIKDGTISISARAFQAKYLKSVEIPNSVIKIGDDAFSNCPYLETVTLPNNNIEIGAWAFSGCSYLQSINIPEKMTEIKPYVFYNCHNLSNISIPESITRIGKAAFCGCWDLTSISIPKNVTTINRSAFQDCRGLTSITVDNNNTTYDSRNNCNA